MVQELELYVGGMVCRGCEESIRAGLASVPGIRDVSVCFKERCVTIWYEDASAARESFSDQLVRIGFPPISSQRAMLDRIAPLTLAVLLGLAVMALPLGMAPMGQVGMAPDQAFAVGLATSVHCVAMCGGLMMSRIAGAAERVTGRHAKVMPVAVSLVYNIGRLCSYVRTGAVLGAVGGAFLYGAGARCVLLGAASIAIILFGLRQMDLLPNVALNTRRLRRSRFGRRIRKLCRAMAGASSNKKSLVLGLLNGFMPCGALGAMWMVAAESGTALAGALLMFAFGLGTWPFMLTFGSLFSLLPERAARALPLIGGVVSVALGISLARMAVMSISVLLGVM